MRRLLVMCTLTTTKTFKFIGLKQLRVTAFGLKGDSFFAISCLP